MFVELRKSGTHRLMVNAPQRDRQEETMDQGSACRASLGDSSKLKLKLKQRRPKVRRYHTRYPDTEERSTSAIHRLLLLLLCRSKASACKGTYRCLLLSRLQDRVDMMRCLGSPYTQLRSTRVYVYTRDARMDTCITRLYARLYDKFANNDCIRELTGGCCHHVHDEGSSCPLS